MNSFSRYVLNSMFLLSEAEILASPKCRDLLLFMLLKGPVCTSFEKEILNIVFRMRAIFRKSLSSIYFSFF